MTTTNIKLILSIANSAAEKNYGIAGWLSCIADAPGVITGKLGRFARLHDGILGVHGCIAEGEDAIAKGNDAIAGPHGAIAAPHDVIAGWKDCILREHGTIAGAKEGFAGGNIRIA